jgi:hypothetical protein
MIKTSMSYAHDGGANREGSTVKGIHTTAAIMLLGSFVDNLLSGRYRWGTCLIESRIYLRLSVYGVDVQ